MESPAIKKIDYRNLHVHAGHDSTKVFRLEQYDVRIAVVRKFTTTEVFDGRTKPKTSGTFEEVCPRLKEGDVYISDEGSCPQGFCN